MSDGALPRGLAIREFPVVGDGDGDGDGDRE